MWWKPTAFCHTQLCTAAGRAAVWALLVAAVRIDQQDYARAGMAALPVVPDEVWLYVILPQLRPAELGSQGESYQAGGEKGAQAGGLLAIDGSVADDKTL
jgi:hypothetical protein